MSKDCVAFVAATRLGFLNVGYFHLVNGACAGYNCQRPDCHLIRKDAGPALQRCPPRPLILVACSFATSQPWSQRIALHVCS